MTKESHENGSIQIFKKGSMRIRSHIAQARLSVVKKVNASFRVISGELILMRSIAQFIAATAKFEDLSLGANILFAPGALEELLTISTLKSITMMGFTKKEELLALASSTQLEKIILFDCHIDNKVKQAFLKNQHIKEILFMTGPNDDRLNRESIQQHAERNELFEEQTLTRAIALTVIKSNLDANAGNPLINHIAPLLNQIIHFIPQNPIHYFERVEEAVDKYQQRFQGCWGRFFTRQSEQSRAFVQSFDDNRFHWKENQQLAEEAVTKYVSVNTKTTLYRFLKPLTVFSGNYEINMVRKPPEPLKRN